MEEDNAYFDTSITTTPKSDGPRYCSNNTTTPKGLNFNCQPEVCTNLRWVGSMCATCTYLFPLLTSMEALR